MMSVPMGEHIDVATNWPRPGSSRSPNSSGAPQPRPVQTGGTLRHHRDELHSISAGNDLSRILPTELAALSHPLRRLSPGPAVCRFVCPGHMNVTGRDRLSCVETSDHSNFPA